jgi:hypothetical protein
MLISSFKRMMSNTLGILLGWLEITVTGGARASGVVITQPESYDILCLAAASWRAFSSLMIRTTMSKITMAPRTLMRLEKYRSVWNNTEKQ